MFPKHPNENSIRDYPKQIASSILKEEIYKSNSFLILILSLFLASIRMIFFYQVLKEISINDAIQIKLSFLNILKNNIDKNLIGNKYRNRLLYFSKIEGLSIKFKGHFASKFNERIFQGSSLL